MFKARENIDNGVDIPTYPTWDPTQPNPFLEQPLLDETNHSDQFSDLSFVSMSSESSGCAD